MEKRLTVLDMADAINKSCEKREYFWACEFIKETIRLWKYETATAFLCEAAQQMADHYRT